MRLVNRDPKRYEYVEQEEFCCVGATIEMILRRHGIKEFAQEDICCELGLYILPGYRSVDCAVTIPKTVGSIFMGMPIRHIPGGINNFFLRHNLPFLEFFISVKEIPDVKTLKDLLASFYEADYDMFVSYKFEWQGEEFVHVGAVDEVCEDRVVLVDTDGLEDGWKVVEMQYEELLQRMKEVRGGVHVIRRIPSRGRPGR